MAKELLGTLTYGDPNGNVYDENSGYQVTIYKDGSYITADIFVSFMSGLTINLKYGSETFEYKTSNVSTFERENIRCFDYKRKYNSIRAVGTKNDIDYPSNTLTWTVKNTVPTAAVNIPELIAGKSSRISWTFSDPDGDDVTATKLTRYHRMPDAANASGKVLFKSSRKAKYYDDAIPAEYAGYTVWYTLEFTDEIGATQTVTSAQKTVLQPNNIPSVTSTHGSSGTSLGTKNESFDFTYTVSDADGDALTVTEKLDGVTKRTFESTGGTYTFEALKSDFQTILNGNHTLSVSASDGKDEAVFTASFTKSVTAASITLAEPLEAAKPVTVAITAVAGSIPDDAVYKVEVTNNAKDSVPVWQDVTDEVRNGENIVFSNTVCTNGAAFNFRVSVSRGPSGVGGYITGITGAFQ